MFKIVKKVATLVLLTFFVFSCKQNFNGCDHTSEEPQTVSYTICFDANGGVGEMENLVVNADEIEEKVLPPKSFTNPGYIFVAWNTEVDGSGLVFKNGEKLSVVFNSVTDVTLYAQWKQSFDLNIHSASEFAAYLEDTLLTDSTENEVAISGGNFSLSTEDLKTISSQIYANRDYIGKLDLSELEVEEFFDSGSGSGGNGIFQKLTELKEVILPKTLVTISEGSFAYCAKLENVTIHGRVTTILWSAFAHCDSLKNITIPDSVVLIDQTVFYECKLLETVNISKTSNLESIGLEAFRGCTALTKFYVPAKVVSLNNRGTDCSSAYKGLYAKSSGNGAFYNCTALKSVYFENTLTNINAYTFQNCPITEVYYAGSEEEWNEIIIGDGNTAIISATKYYKN